MTVPACQQPAPKEIYEIHKLLLANLLCTYLGQIYKFHVKNKLL